MGYFVATREEDNRWFLGQEIRDIKQALLTYQQLMNRKGTDGVKLLMGRAVLPSVTVTLLYPLTPDEKVLTPPAPSNS